MNERKYALVIGINEYENRVPKLRNARQDAEAVAEQLEKEPHSYEVKLLPDGDATGDAVRDFLRNLPAGPPEGSSFVLYFAGHGVLLPGDEVTGPEGSLLMYEARRDDPDSWFGMSELRGENLLERLRSSYGHVLVILDCCHAGAFATATRGIESEARPPLHTSQYERYLTMRAWQALTSAAADELAADASSRFADRRGGEGHSPFATALVDGLMGGADASTFRFAADGVITATELYSYIRNYLMDGDGPVRQTPSIWPLEPENKGEFIFRNPKIEKLDITPDPDLEKTPNPWCGLKPYTAADAELFFGRQEATDQLVALVGEPATIGSLIAVVGASGAGKSSLLQAGLRPRLETAGAWTVVEAARLRGDPNVPLDAAERDLHVVPSGGRGLLLIDQFEELFTQCPDNDDRDRFQKRLDELIAAPGGPTVVVGLRSDFAAQTTGWGQQSRWKATRFQVAPFTTDELREVIEGPAGRRAIVFDPPELVGRLVDEVNGVPGALPLLSFALYEMYRQLQGRWVQERGQVDAPGREISNLDYDNVGGVVGALDRRATELYEAADDAKKKATRLIFLRLVVQEGTTLTGRRAETEELEFGGEQQEHVDAVINDYDGAGLLVVDGDYVAPAHGALIREWQLLRDWVEASDSQATLRTAWTDAREWKDHDKSRKRLWDQNPRLELLKASRADLNALERDFLRASIRRRNLRKVLIWTGTGLVIAGLLFITVKALIG